jgi:hypothetical protein
MAVAMPPVMAMAMAMAMAMTMAMVMATAGTTPLLDLQDLPERRMTMAMAMAMGMAMAMVMATAGTTPLLDLQDLPERQDWRGAAAPPIYSASFYVRRLMTDPRAGCLSASIRPGTALRKVGLLRVPGGSRT